MSYKNYRWNGSNRNDFGNSDEIFYPEEMKLLEGIKRKYLTKLIEIKNSQKCFGDKVREIMKLTKNNNNRYCKKTS